MGRSSFNRFTKLGTDKELRGSKSTSHIAVGS